MSGTAFSTTDVMVVGTGGQGVLTATDILAEAAIAKGWDVKKTEVAGMAQRGGTVTSHLRFGPKVLAPAIAPGTADVLLAFEAAEALRWITWLRPEGMAVVNTQRVIPPVVSNGLFQYPDDPIAELKAHRAKVYAVDAGAIAVELGNARLANTVMLGALADTLPFGAELLREVTLTRFSKRPEMLDANRRAFEAGRAAADALARIAPSAAE
jgi:indolepyruvate ferredoxin oxidoreductase beta subunit